MNMTTPEATAVVDAAPASTTAAPARKRFVFNWRPVVYLTLGSTAIFAICAAVTWFCFGEAY
jgi:hypothetical protein